MNLLAVLSSGHIAEEKDNRKLTKTKAFNLNLAQPIAPKVIWCDSTVFTNS